ncbi:MAG TPA: Ig-like domain-containing protein [Bryobacteraceae bacterium]|jgi:outer membrane biosynthesis protein TonB|nr:Ig-like domain-containing protein [Bryobacteraceae bacterium]
MTTIFRFTAFLLIPLLARLPLAAQTPANLRISELTETGDRNTLAVEVTDSQGVPVPEAAVTFRLPEDAPGAAFADGTRAAVVNTDRLGQARITGIHWQAGETAAVRVTATKGTSHAGILLERKIAQLSALPQPASQAKPVVQNAAPPSPSTPAPKPIAQMKPIAPPEAKPVRAPTPAPVVAAAPTPAVTAAPTIEPPRVSITSVSRKQTDTPIASTASPSASPDPKVLITGAGQRNHGSSKKWIILALVAAGAAGAAIAVMERGKSSPSSTATSNTGVSIGAPTISIGAP